MLGSYLELFLSYLGLSMPCFLLLGIIILLIIIVKK